jgi:hypothetical protein
MLGGRFLNASAIPVNGILLGMKPAKTVEHFQSKESLQHDSSDQVGRLFAA